MAGKGITIISRFFPPEAGAAQERLRSFAYELASAEQPITVITTLPSYPSYTAQKVEDLSLPEHVRLIRLWTPRWGRRYRLITDLWFAKAAFLKALFMKKPQLIITSSPPFFLGFTVLWLRIFRRIPYLLDIRDLYPDSLIDVGALRQPWLQKVLKYCERLFYRHAAHVVTVSEWMKDRIATTQQGTKVSAICNGVDMNVFSAGAARDFSFIQGNKKVAVYIGNFGRVYDFDPLIEAAKQLPDWQFVFVGGGYQKERLLAHDHITVVPAIESRYIPALLKRCDLGLVSLKNIPLAQGSIPTKMFEYIAAELPIAGNIYGESAKYFAAHFQPFRNAAELVDICSRELPAQEALPERFTRAHSGKQLRTLINEIR